MAEVRDGKMLFMAYTGSAEGTTAPKEKKPDRDPTKPGAGVSDRK